MDGIGTKKNIKLTTRNDNPDKIQEKVVKPKVIRFRPAICEPFMVMIEHARSIVENIAIDLTQGNQGLQRVTKGMLSSDQHGHDER